MSRKKTETVKVKSEYVVEPEEAYKGTVVKSGTGAVIKSYKKYIGKEALVIIEGKKPKIIDKYGADVTDIADNW